MTKNNCQARGFLDVRGIDIDSEWCALLYEIWASHPSRLYASWMAYMVRSKDKRNSF